MQHATEIGSETILQKLKTVVCVLTWAAGLILAGSDGPMMPYANIIGAGLFAGASLWLARQSGERDERCTTPVSLTGGPVRPTAVRVVPVRACRRKSPAVRSRYARELGVV